MNIAFAMKFYRGLTPKKDPQKAKKPKKEAKLHVPPLLVSG